MRNDAERKYEIAQVILAVWDSRNNRYIENVSDAYVAMTYGFSVDQVQKVREEFFDNAREKAKTLKAVKSDLAKQISKTRDIYADLIRIWVCADQMSRLSPRLASQIANLLIDIENFHQNADAGREPDHKNNQAALVRSARYVIQHRRQIQLFLVAMKKLAEVVRRSGLEVNLHFDGDSSSEFEAIKVRDNLPLMKKSADRRFPMDDDIEDPHAWETG